MNWRVACDLLHRNRQSSSFSLASRGALVVFKNKMEKYQNICSNPLFWVCFSLPVLSFSPTQRQTCAILRTQDRHPTHSPPGRGRPLSGAPCRRFIIKRDFLTAFGSLRFDFRHTKPHQLEGATETFFVLFLTCFSCLLTANGG